MNWLKKISESFFAQLMMMLGAFAVLLGIVFFCLTIYANSLSGSMRGGHSHDFKVEYVNNKVYLVDHDNESKISVIKSVYQEPAFERIIGQMNEIRKRSESHDKTMIFFFQQQYIFNLLQAFMILVTTIFMLVVSKYGWDNVDRWLLIAFFVCGGYVAFFNVIPQSLKIQDNIHNNKKYYLIYDNAESSIITYLATGENSEGVFIKPNDYVHKLDKQLKMNNDISFDLDDIPKQDFQFDKK